MVINKFDTDDEIVQRSNGSKYGLMAEVFTQDINRALRLSSAIDAGVVGVNCISTISFSFRRNEGEWAWKREWGACSTCIH